MIWTIQMSGSLRRKRLNRRNKEGSTRSGSPRPPRTTGPTFYVKHIAEPELEFAHGQTVAYPRDGLFLFGPVDAKRQFSATRYGVIGTPAGVDRFRRWSKTLAGYIPIPAPGPRSRSIEPSTFRFRVSRRRFTATGLQNLAQSSQTSPSKKSATRYISRIGTRPSRDA